MLRGVEFMKRVEEKGYFWVRETLDICVRRIVHELLEERFSPAHADFVSQQYVIFQNDRSLPPIPLSHKTVKQAAQEGIFMT